MEEVTITAKPDESRAPGQGPGAPRATDYIAPGLYRWMLELPADDYQEGDTIANTAGLREHKRQGKKEWRERYQRAAEDARRSLAQSPPGWECLSRQRQPCTLCPIRMRRREIWKHPLIAVRSIYRSWMAHRAFRRRMITDLEAMEKSAGERPPG